MLVIPQEAKSCNESSPVCCFGQVEVFLEKDKYCTKVKKKRLIDVSGIIEKFNVFVTLAIVPKTKDINKAF